MKLDAKGNAMHFRDLNERVRACADKEVVLENCIGQRYIGSGLSGKHLEIHGTPGNALGAYLDGATITVHGNAQDATGDTMNDGAIYVHGAIGDAAGYAMRGGKIMVEGNAGYRAGIHMKAYQEKLPVLVIGGSAGSFLGEYQAGGVIIVLGIGADGVPVGNFCSTGMHGGKIFIRSAQSPDNLPPQVEVHKAKRAELQEIDSYLKEFCQKFDKDQSKLMETDFWVLSPSTNNPYRRLYTAN